MMMGFKAYRMISFSLRLFFFNSLYKKIIPTTSTIDIKILIIMILAVIELPPKKADNQKAPCMSGG